MKRPMIPTTQEQLVKEKLGFEPKIRHEITEKVTVPGIENLHLKSAEEIGRTLAMIIKSRVSVSAITYKVGEYVEVTSISDIKV